MNEKNEDLKMNDIENIKKEVKNKECIVDQDYSLIKKVENVIDVDVDLNDNKV